MNTVPAEIAREVPARPREQLPESPRPEIMFRRRVGLVSAIVELWRYRELIITLAERDLRVRYKQAALGIAWALVTPLLLMAAFQFVFKRFADVSAHGVPYPLFAAIGLVPWSFFSTAFARGGTSLVTNIPLLNKLYCPREVFPLASIALAMADAIASGLVLLLLFPITGFTPRVESLWAPLLLLIAVVFTMGVTMAAASVVVYLRDLQVLLPLIVQFGLFVTPVGYGMESVVTGTAKLAIFAVLNPLAPVIDGLRHAVLFGHAPQLIPTLAGAASATLWLIVGFVWFKRMEAGLADIA